MSSSKREWELTPSANVTMLSSFAAATADTSTCATAATRLRGGFAINCKLKYFNQRIYSLN